MRKPSGAELFLKGVSGFVGMFFTCIIAAIITITVALAGFVFSIFTLPFTTYLECVRGNNWVWQMDDVPSWKSLR